MKRHEKIETKFLVPLYEDAEVDSERQHHAARWKWLQNELIVRFGGYTQSSTVKGVWVDPETGNKCCDESREYHVDIAVNQLSEMEELLEAVAVNFRQKCIRFVSKGKVRYIENARVQ